MHRWRKPLLIALAVLASLVVVGLLGYQFALRQLQSVVLTSLGPRATVGELTVDWAGIELHDVRIAADRGGRNAWPAEDELRAKRLRLIPQWGSLWAGDGTPRRIARVQAEGLYLSVLRTRQGLRLLPSLLETPPPKVAADGTVQASVSPASAPAAMALAVLIRRVSVVDAAVDFYDATVARSAHRLQLTQLQAEVGPLAWPGLDKPAQLSLRGRLKGQGGAGSRDGDVHIDGELTPSTRDAHLKVNLNGVDLRVLQPYLLRVNEGGVERGVLDMSLDATVRQQRLRAPGTVVITGLELGHSQGLFGNFAGVPQQLVLAAMRKQGRIELKFTLEGRLDDPAFSINESLATRLTFGLAEALGVSVGGVVEGLGSVIKGLFGR